MTKVIIEKLNPDEIENRKNILWPIWEKEISIFDWEYSGDEEFLVIEGEVEITTDEGSFIIREGDFVTFRKGLKCVWDVKKPIRKYYNFP